MGIFQILCQNIVKTRSAQTLPTSYRLAGIYTTSSLAINSNRFTVRRAKIVFNALAFACFRNFNVPLVFHSNAST